MKKALLLFTIIVHLTAIAAESAAAETQSMDLTYESRGVQVPATVAIPGGEGPFPLVVIMHGHGDYRNNPGYVNIAASLAEQGIASIRMDFPGCGDSTEDFSMNTESNMKQDVISGINHAINNYPIDITRVGTFGYSMGGRLILELIVDEAFPFKAIVMIAPAADTDDLELLFGGQDGWDKLKKQAESSREGVTTFQTDWGPEYHLSKEWFENIEEFEGKSLVSKAAEKFRGPALVIYSVNDVSVSPGVSKAVADALDAQIVVVPADGHNYGFYSNGDIISSLVTSAATAFFLYDLKNDTPGIEVQNDTETEAMYATVTTPNKGPLNFRAGESLSAKLITRIPNGTRIRILSQGTEWTQVLYKEKEGYVMTKFLDFLAPP